MSVNSQIVNLSNLYVDNLQLSATSGTTLTLTAGAARDSTNNVDIVLNESIVINSAVHGAGGIDNGTFSAASWYAVYVIGSSANKAQPSALISRNFSEPVLPLNYDCFRRVGVALTTTPTQFLILWQEGTGKHRKYTIDEESEVLVGGAATTFTNINLINGVPPIGATSVLLTYDYSVQTAGNSFTLITGESTATIGTVLVNNTTTSQPERDQVEIIATLVGGNPTIKYKVTQAGDTLDLNVSGFYDYL